MIGTFNQSTPMLTESLKHTLNNHLNIEFKITDKYTKMHIFFSNKIRQQTSLGKNTNKNNEQYSISNDFIEDILCKDKCHVTVI